MNPADYIARSGMSCAQWLGLPLWRKQYEALAYITKSRTIAEGAQPEGIDDYSPTEQNQIMLRIGEFIGLVNGHCTRMTAVLPSRRVLPMQKVFKR